MSFDEIEKSFNKLYPGNEITEDLLAHLRQQELRLTAWEEQTKKLTQRFTSLDEEFYAHVEGAHSDQIFTSNPVEMAPEYQAAQGFGSVGTSYSIRTAQMLLITVK